MNKEKIIVPIAILIGIAAFVMAEPKIIESVIIFAVFGFASGLWITCLLAGRLTPSTTFIFAASFWTLISGISLPNYLWLAWSSFVLAALYLTASIISLYAEIKQAITLKSAQRG